MALHNISIHDPGFTIIELLTTLTIISILGLGVIGTSINSLKNWFIFQDIELVDRTLTNARFLSVVNYDGKAHGVKLDQNKIIEFNGNSYNPTAQTNIHIDTGLTLTNGTGHEILFSTFSGTASKEIIPLKDYLLIINEAGVINP